jgi:hypothetical protein
LGKLCQSLGDETLAHLEHDLEPEQEALRVEALVFPGSRAMPQIFVEDVR